jgi:hypothetical protein
VRSFPGIAAAYIAKANTILLSTGDQRRARQVLSTMRDRVAVLPVAAYLLYFAAGGEFLHEFDRLPLGSANAASLADTLAFLEAKALRLHSNDQRERMRGSFDSLRLAVEAVEAPSSPDFFLLPRRAVAYAGLGREKQARQALGELLAFAQRTESQGDGERAGGLLYSAAVVFMLLGEHEQATEQLKRWLVLPTGGTPAYLRIDPVFVPLRRNSSFRRLTGGS